MGHRCSTNTSCYWCMLFYRGWGGIPAARKLSGLIYFFFVKWLKRLEFNLTPYIFEISIEIGKEYKCLLCFQLDCNWITFTLTQLILTVYILYEDWTFRPVYLSTLPFVISFELWYRDFIFGTHVQLITTCQVMLRSDFVTLNLTFMLKIAFLNFVAGEA